MQTLIAILPASAADELVKQLEETAEFKGQYSVVRVESADILGLAAGEGMVGLVISVSGAVKDKLKGTAVNKVPGMHRDFIPED